MRVTGPVKGDTTEVAWSLSKSTVPGASIVLAIADGNDRIELDVAALRLGQPDVGDGAGVAPSFSSGDDEQPATKRARARRRSR